MPTERPCHACDSPVDNPRSFHCKRHRDELTTSCLPAARRVAIDVYKQFIGAIRSEEDDLHGEALLALTRAAILYDPDNVYKAKFVTYAYNAMSNHVFRFCIKEKRKAARRIGTPTEDGLAYRLLLPRGCLETADDPSGRSAWEEVHHSSQIEAVRAAVRQLPPEMATAVELRYLKEETTAEIGVRMGVTAQRVLYLSRQGLQRLKKLKGVFTCQDTDPTA